jgi:hypothetical protein
LLDEPWHTVIIECATEHETDHLQDVNCRGCELYRPNFRLFVSQRRAECRATNVELACVARNIPRCGGNPTCLEGLEARRRALVTYSEGFRGCTVQ